MELLRFYDIFCLWFIIFIYKRISYFLYRIPLLKKWILKKCPIKKYQRLLNAKKANLLHNIVCGICSQPSLDISPARNMVTLISKTSKSRSYIRFWFRVCFLEQTSVLRTRFTIVSIINVCEQDSLFSQYIFIDDTFLRDTHLSIFYRDKYIYLIHIGYQLRHLLYYIILY